MAANESRHWPMKYHDIPVSHVLINEHRTPGEGAFLVVVGGGLVVDVYS